MQHQAEATHAPTTADRRTFHTFETLGNMVHLGELSWDAVFCLLNTVMSKALPVCYMTFTF